MVEQALGGGLFGEGYLPEASSSAPDFVVHGGLLGGVGLGPAPDAPGGWPSAEVGLALDVLAEFGGPAEYQPVGGDPFRIAHGAVFRANHITVDPSTGVPATSREPHALVLEAEIGGGWDARDLVVTRDRHGVDRLYRLVDVEPDGEVCARLRLHEVRA